MKELRDLAELALRVAHPIRKEKGFIKVVAHFDADGIASAAIIYKTLEYLQKNFELSFVKQLEKPIVKDIAKKKADLYLFVDLGSGQLNSINEYIKSKPVVVIDHHQPVEIKRTRLYHFNPHLIGIDGANAISGAGLTYIVSRILTQKAKDLIDLAIVGAAGDMQQIDGRFIGINKLLLDDALINGAIKHETGIRLFGRYTRPLHKVLEYMDDPFIPGISGSESGCIQLLSELGIPLTKPDGKWRTLSDLSKAEEKRLATTLVMEGVAKGGTTKSLIGDIFRLRNNYEIREFATILNACGRIEKPLEGLKLCSGETSSVPDILREYRKKIASYLRWVKENKKRFYRTRNAVYVIAKDRIDDNIIGTVTSMAVKSVFEEPVVFGFANAENGVKISARVKKTAQGLNLGKAIRLATEKMGKDSEGGGHINAAGGKIPLGKEKKFIHIVDPLLYENS